MGIICIHLFPVYFLLKLDLLTEIQACISPLTYRYGSLKHFEKHTRKIALTMFCYTLVLCLFVRTLYYNSWRKPTYVFCYTLVLCLFVRIIIAGGNVAMFLLYLGAMSIWLTRSEQVFRACINQNRTTRRTA